MLAKRDGQLSVWGGDVYCVFRWLVYCYFASFCLLPLESDESHVLVLLSMLPVVHCGHGW